MRMRLLLFEIQRYTSMLKATGDLVFLTTLVDICEIDFSRPALNSYHNVIHSPMKIDTVPSISAFQLSYWSLPLGNFQSENNIIDPLCCKLKT